MNIILGCIAICVLQDVMFAYCTLHPVIIVPGYSGSPLQAKWNRSNTANPICSKHTSDYLNIWLNPVLLLPASIECWADVISLHYDNSTGSVMDAPGVDIRIPGFSDPKAVESINGGFMSTWLKIPYMFPLVQALVNAGHVRGKTIRSAPYDFRKSLIELQNYLTILKELIEETYFTNSNTTVSLVGHSMGGTITSYFLLNMDIAWKNKFIHRFIALSTPWGGATQSVKTYTLGINLSLQVINKKVLGKVLSSFPSTAFLMPMEPYWSPSDVLVQTPKMNYTVANYQEFFSDFSVENGWEMFSNLKDYRMEMKALEVEVHCIYGTETPTIDQITFLTSDYSSLSAKIKYGNGDGTINMRSLEGCERLRNNQKQNVFVKSFHQAGHGTIISNKAVLKHITKLTFTP